MKRRGTTFDQWLTKQRRDPKFAGEYDRLEIPTRLAVKIAMMRDQQGLTQRALARKLGVSQQAISRLEDQEAANYTLATLQKVAKALGKELVVDLK